MGLFSLENWWLWLPAVWIGGVLLGWGAGWLMFKRRQFMLGAELTEAKEERTTLQVRLQKTLAELASRSADLSSAMKGKGALEAAARVRERELTAKTLELEAALRKQAALEASLRARENDLVTKSNEFIAALARHSALESSLQARENDLMTKSNELMMLIAQKNMLENSLRSKDDEIASMAAKLQAAQKDRAFFESALEAQTKEVQNLRVQLDAANSELGIAKSAIKAYERSLEARVTQVSQLETELRQTHRPSPAARGEGIPRRDKQTPPQQKLTTTADLGAASSMPFVPPPPPPIANSKSRMATPRETTGNGHEEETARAAQTPQHLSDVKGIGSTFEKRLYQAGIACYWQLAQLSDADIKRVLQLTELQTDRMDFEQIRNDALALAKKSRSEGSVWTDEPPDDFGLIEGLGRTYERRLYDAGIWTYDRLSRSTADQVRRICDSQNARKLNCEDWINRAKMLAALKSRPARGR